MGDIWSFHFRDVEECPKHRGKATGHEQLHDACREINETLGFWSRQIFFKKGVFLLLFLLPLCLVGYQYLEIGL